MRRHNLPLKYLAAIVGIVFCCGAQEKSPTIRRAQHFTISAVAGEHGKVSPSGSVTVTQGGHVTFSTKADSGYQVDSVIVDGSDQGMLTSYTFTNVSYEHTLRVTFVRTSRPHAAGVPAPDSSKVKQEHAITTMAGAHGSIFPPGTVFVAHHRIVEFAVNADPGYAVDSVFVDEVAIGRVTTYTFVDVMYDHTLRATFVKGK